MPKQNDVAKWIAKAELKQIKRNQLELERHPSFGRITQAGDWAICADGYRMHSAKCIVTDAHAPDAQTPDYLSLIPTCPPHSLTVSTWALVQAVETCIPFAPSEHHLTRFSANGQLDVSAVSANAGDVRVSIIAGDTWSMRKGKRVQQMGIDYTHTGKDIEFALNAKYALDALAGMGPLTTIRYTSAVKPFVFESVVNTITRKAIIMPMHLS